MDTVGVFSGEWIECRKDQNGIMHVVFASKNASVNKFNRATLSELKEVVSHIKADTSRKGVLFSSAKSVFIVGADKYSAYQYSVAVLYHLRENLASASVVLVTSFLAFTRA